MFANVRAKLDELLSGRRTTPRHEDEAPMSDNATLQAQVTALPSVKASVVALVNGMATQVKAAGTDPAVLASLTQRWQQDASASADAVAANIQGAT